jgi:hypothetical protein
MNIAVLSCGPSLPRFWSEERTKDYGSVIAINTAGWKFSCDWLCGSDLPVFEPIVAGTIPAPRIGCLTNVAMPIPIQLQRELLPIYHLNLRNLTPRMQAIAEAEGMSECAWTFPNALHFARSMAQGGEIHVYGFDAVPGADVAGQGVHNHNNKRWRRELPWIQEEWGYDVWNYSDLSPIVEWWLDTKGDQETLYRLFPC